MTRVRETVASDVDRVVKALEDEIERMAEEFDANRGRLCNEWLDFEVAQALPGHMNYTLVPRDFYERLARAVLRTMDGERDGPVL